jgi:hypothetical protein
MLYQHATFCFHAMPCHIIDSCHRPSQGQLSWSRFRGGRTHSHLHPPAPSSPPPLLLLLLLLMALAPRLMLAWSMFWVAVAMAAAAVVSRFWSCGGQALTLSQAPLSPLLP